MRATDGGTATGCALCDLPVKRQSCQEITSTECAWSANTDSCSGHIELVSPACEDTSDVCNGGSGRRDSVKQIIAASPKTVMAWISPSHFPSGSVTIYYPVLLVVFLVGHPAIGRYRMPHVYFGFRLKLLIREFLPVPCLVVIGCHFEFDVDFTTSSWKVPLVSMALILNCCNASRVFLVFGFTCFIGWPYWSFTISMMYPTPRRSVEPSAG